MGFAVVKLSGKQYKVVEGDVLITEKLKGVDVGSEIDLDEVLLIANKHHSYIGRPVVPAVEVKAVCEQQTKDKKVIVFKKKKRKGYRRRTVSRDTSPCCA